MSNSNLEYFEKKFAQEVKKEAKLAKYKSKVFWVKFFDWDNEGYIKEPHRMHVR